MSTGRFVCSPAEPFRWPLTVVQCSRRLLYLLIFKLLLKKWTERNRKKNYHLFPGMVPVSDKQARSPSWNNLQVTFLKSCRPFFWSHRKYLPWKTASENGIVWNSTWLQRFTSHAKFWFQQHWCTLISMEIKVFLLCYTQIQQAGPCQFWRMCF